MIKYMTLIEPTEGWTLATLGLPSTAVLISQDTDTELGVFSYHKLLLECLMFVDNNNVPAAWMHGTDCPMTKAVRSSMNDGAKDEPFIPACTRRIQGGAFRAIPLPTIKP